MTAAELAAEKNIHKIRAAYGVWSHENFELWDGSGSLPKPRQRFVRGFGVQQKTCAQASGTQRMKYAMPEEDSTAFDF
eukprot:SAG31_NODE_3267_length_4478_cov_2.996118_6_plen_78_part_00